MPTVPTKCLSCHADLKTPVVCEKCHSLYPVPAQVDYFGLFQLPHRYDLDPAELEARFFSISRNIHPDFFGTQPPEMQQLAVRLAAEHNEAYRVLKDPFLRAEYLLELSGGESAAQDKSVPDGLLAEVMTLREKVEEALEADDRATLERHGQQVRRLRREALDEIAALAGKLNDAKYAERLKLRQVLNSIKYYDNLLRLL